MDDIYGLEQELSETTGALGKLTDDLKSSAKAEANLRSDYENKKNKLLIILFDEEAESGKKRTEQIRTAIYRAKFADERRSWLLAKADLESNRDLLKGLLSKIDSLRTLISLEKAKIGLV